MVRTDSLGQVYTLTGQQAYNALNLNLNTLGLAVETIAPALALPDAPGGLVGTYDDSANTFTVAYTPSPLVGDVQLVIYATRPLSQGIRFQPRGAYKLIKVTPIEDTSPSDIHAAYVAIFGEASAGQKILLKAKIIDGATGFASPDVDFATIVVA